MKAISFTKLIHERRGRKKDTKERMIPALLDYATFFDGLPFEKHRNNGIQRAMWRIQLSCFSQLQFLFSLC